MEPCRDTCMLLQWMKFLWMLLFRDIEIATVGTLWHAFWRGPYKHEPKKWGYHQLWGGRFLRCGTLQKLHKAKGQKSCHRVPTIKGRPVVPSLFRLMLIRLEGEGDFFDVGHSKNCIRPKAKKHVTEYPQKQSKFSLFRKIVYKTNYSPSATTYTDAGAAWCIWRPKAKIDHLVWDAKLLLINMNYV